METGVLELKNNLSAILQDVESGKTERVVVKRYGKPVAQIVPYEPEERDVSKRIGLYEGKEIVKDWKEFDAMDDEITHMFGA